MHLYSRHRKRGSRKRGSRKRKTHRKQLRMKRGRRQRGGDYVQKGDFVRIKGVGFATIIEADPHTDSADNSTVFDLTIKPYDGSPVKKLETFVPIADITKSNKPNEML